jgi:hypothetical protein
VSGWPVPLYLPGEEPWHSTLRQQSEGWGSRSFVAGHQ